MVRKYVCILFPDNYLPYSPTIINIANCLVERGFDVEVFWIDNGGFEESAAFSWSRPLRVPAKVKKVLAFFGAYSFFCLTLLALAAARKGRQALGIIGVDQLGFIAARLMRNDAIWLSLETYDNFWFRVAKIWSVRSLVSQSDIRAQFIVAGSNISPRLVFLPNSPIFVNKELGRSSIDRRFRPVRCVYFGTIVPLHGVEQCIDAVLEFGSAASITLHGIISRKYLAELRKRYSEQWNKAIYVHSTYVTQNEIVEYLSGFDIGFVLYDLKLASHQFNYSTCPSGKMYNYFNAGIPVIGSAIEGLAVVQQSIAGVLVDTLDVSAVSDAIATVVANYEMYSGNARRAARENDFRLHFERSFLPLLLQPDV